ncbi:hypothetical protein AAT19DRAFT_13684 [Rhodotorula toruloides]|uniref:Uncharacterized protein n=1 Tax=Rhodotorula toruloides TaxID=5286 RepID=A0A2T0AC79_RHOTO|nr:hypothetical protein AAT19DRAFT_13684 [Rhodotorula toruloides]
MPPTRSRPIPPDTAVNPQKLVQGFREVQEALVARAAHYANLRDKQGAAPIGFLMVGLQDWIDTCWNEHLFHIDVHIGSSEQPFASNRALRNNFCTWWLLNETQQTEIIEWLTDLSGTIRRGEFDRADSLPPFKDLRLATPVYAIRERDAGTPQGQLSTRLGTASVTKAMNWIAAFDKATYKETEYTSKSFVAPQLVPPPTRFSWHKVAQALLSTHDRVQQDGLSIENFVSWGQEWWTQLFQAHEGKPYLALWYCLTEQQQGDVVDFLKARCDHLRVHGEQALTPFNDSPLAVELEDSRSHVARTVAKKRRLVRQAIAQAALIKTTLEGYDHEPPMPACLTSSAHSLGSSLLNKFSHRQCAIYGF